MLLTSYSYTENANEYTLINNNFEIHCVNSAFSRIRTEYRHVIRSDTIKILVLSTSSKFKILIALLSSRDLINIFAIKNLTNSLKTNISQQFLLC